MAFTKIAVPYGCQFLSLNIEPRNFAGVVTPPNVDPAPDPKATIEDALDHPVGAQFPVLSKTSKVIIVVDDATRVTPTQTLLSALLGRIQELGVSRERVSIGVANGLHVVGDQTTLHSLLGEAIAKSYRVVNHDARDKGALVYVGHTTRGTPVDVNRAIMQSDIRFLTGIIEPHQLAGYSGGVKAVVPGLSSERTITANHSLMLNEDVQVGRIDGNPLREDLEEAVNLTHKEGLGQDFIVNSIVNDDRKIVQVVAGDEITAHRKGVALSRDTSSVPAPKEADVVIASPGGYPRDINLYQSQKALAHIERIIRPGGVAVLAAECRNGTGSKMCEDWMKRDSKPADIIQRIKNEGFNMGAHKAYQFARFMVRARVILVTNLPADLTKSMHIDTARSLEQGYQEALNIAGRDSRVIVCPRATAMLPEPTSRQR
jgi:nickel-dependent lactate racemase